MGPPTAWHSATEKSDEMIIASELIAIEKKELTSIEPSVVEIDF